MRLDRSSRRYIRSSVVAGLVIGFTLIPVVNAGTIPISVDHDSSEHNSSLADKPTAQLPDFAYIQPPKTEPPREAPKPAPVQHEQLVDCQASACIALTFDDGPDPATTPRIMAALANEHVRGTFFLIGNRVASNANIVRQMYVNGDEVGNHSWSHPDFGKLTPPQIEQQVGDTQNAITATGVPPPPIFRPPYGIKSQAEYDHIHLPIITWNVDPRDWAEHDPNRVADIVIAGAKPGAIILMHDTKSTTADAVSRIVATLKPNYKLVTVSQLLNLTPDSHGLFIGR